MPLAQWPSFMEDIWLAQENVFTTEYCIFVFEALQNFYFATSTLLKERNLTYLRSDGTRSHPGKPVRKRRPLTRMQMSTLRTVNSIVAVVKQVASLRGLGIDLLHIKLSLHVKFS